MIITIAAGKIMNAYVLAGKFSDGDYLNSEELQVLYSFLDTQIDNCVQLLHLKTEPCEEQFSLRMQLSGLYNIYNSVEDILLARGLI